MRPSSGVRRALPLLLCLLAGLCACKRGDDPRAPFTDSRIPPGLGHRFYPPQGWAWGLLQIGKAPPVRYGVAAPATTARGQIVILPSYGETAEAWFWTVRDLVARGYVVWVLEGSGQGGSGRRSLPRDVVDAPDLDPDVAAAAVLVAQTSGDRPRYLLGAGTSTPIAIRAAALGFPLDGLILFRPRFIDYSDPGSVRRVAAKPGKQDIWLHRIGLGRHRTWGGQGWRADQLIEFLKPSEAASRQAISREWQRANPDLRMGDPSADWAIAYHKELEAAGASWSKVLAPTLVIGLDICARRANCRRVPESTAEAQRDPHAAFIDQLLGFIDPSRAALAPAPAGVTVDDQS